MPKVPVVIEASSNDERVIDLYSKMLQDRIIFLGSAIDDTVANSIVAQMLYLTQKDDSSDIVMYINSPGGSVPSGLAIYDVMQYIPCDVSTVCIGMCASMGSLLMTAGAKGKRFALPHGRIMIHQPWVPGVIEGTATDINIRAEELINSKRLLNEIYRRHTGQTLEKLEEDTDRDRFMSPKDAVEYGLIDKVIDKMPTKLDK